MCVTSFYIKEEIYAFIILTYIYMYIYMYVCVCIYQNYTTYVVCGCMRICIYICVCTYIHTYVYVHIYIRFDMKNLFPQIERIKFTLL